MHDYELLLMLDPETAEERQNEILSRMRQLVESRGAQWLGHEPWGRRRLAYEIDKRTDGVYHLVHFDAEPETLDELTRILSITDGVMRHLAVRRIRGAAPGMRRAPAEAPAEPAGAPSGPRGYSRNTRSDEGEES
jgi:small subunit ribosomal protein S6